MAKKAGKSKSARRAKNKVSNSPTAQLARRVRALQRQLRSSQTEANALAQDLEKALTDVDRLTERVQFLEDDKAKLEVQLRETVQGLDDPRDIPF